MRLFAFKGTEIELMKKYAMLTVKGAIGLLPTSFRNRLKKNTALTAFYSRSLHKSGLFYGLPSKKKALAMYKQYLKWQEIHIAQVVRAASLSTHKENNLISVVILGEKKLDYTLASLNNIGHTNQVIIVSDSGTNTIINGMYNGDLCVTSTLSDAFLKVRNDEHVLLINSGEQLHKAALTLFQRKLNSSDVVYCDTDNKDHKGQLHSPRFYPDWNADLHFTTAYVNTAVALNFKWLKSCSSICEADNVRSIAQLVLLLWLKEDALRDSPLKIEHLPLTLVHSAHGVEHQKRALPLVAESLRTHCVIEVTTNETLGLNILMWPATQSPLVSLIIPTKDAWQLVKACIDSILEKTRYENYEILLIDNGSTEVESLAYFEQISQHPKVRLLNYDHPFNYSAINNFGVKQANGEVVGLINNDIEVISGDWLTYMVGHALRKDIGCVGAKLYYSDDRVQHAGVVMGYGGGAGHAHKYFPRFHAGYLNRLVATHRFSAVTAACLVVEKNLFEKVGGLNESLAVAFNDVDFCLRVRELGYSNLYCAEAELYHHESVSRGLDVTPEKAARFNAELAYLQDTWASVIKADPAYSPNLTLRRENFSFKQKNEYGNG